MSGASGSMSLLDTAFKIWERERMKKIIRSQRQHNLPSQIKQQQQQEELWYMHTTKLFRLLSNAWELERASIVGEIAVAVGASLLTKVPDDEGYYRPCERAKLFHERNHDNHAINLSIRAMIAAALGDQERSKTTHRELAEKLEEMFLLDDWKKLWMDKSGIRNNFGSYVTALLPTLEESRELVFTEVVLNNDTNNVATSETNVERCRRKVLVAASMKEEDNEEKEEEDVEREDARTITKADLYERYVNRGRPVILTHFFDRAAAASVHWNRTQWSIEDIVREHNNSTVLITHSSSIATRQYLHYSVPRALSTSEKLGSFYSNMGNDSHFESCDPPYLFAKMTENKRENLFGRSFSELTDLFDDQCFHFTDEERLASALFYIGPEMSGAYFHSHTNAVNILAEGRKLWHLLPPGVSHGPILGNFVDWMENVLPTMKQKPLKVVQRPGELLFVPTAWSHATLNLETTLGVAIEIGVDLELSTNH